MHACNTWTAKLSACRKFHVSPKSNFNQTLDGREPCQKCFILKMITFDISAFTLTFWQKMANKSEGHYRSNLLIFLERKQPFEQLWRHKSSKTTRSEVIAQPWYRKVLRSSLHKQIKPQAGVKYLTCVSNLLTSFRSIIFSLSKLLM